MKSAKILYPWFVWGLGALFYALEYVARVFPSIVKTQLMSNFRIDATLFGILSISFSIPYIILQIPAGTFTDVFSIKKVLTFMAALCGIGCFVFAHAKLFSVACVGRFMMGFGGAFAFVGTLKLATIWFSPKRLGLLAGLTQSIGMLGAAMGEIVMSILVGHIGWQASIRSIGYGLLVLAILIFFIVTKNKSTNQYTRRDYNQMHTSLLTLKRVLKSRQAWINALYVGLLFVPIGTVGELWGVSYMNRVHHLSIEEAASVSSMIFFGWIFGGPIWGWVSDRFNRRKPIMIGSAFFSLSWISLALYLPNTNEFTLSLLLFMYGFTNTGVSVGYAVAGEMFSKAVSGTSMAFANMATVILAWSLQPVIGYILDLQWQGKFYHGARIYSPHNYKLAMLVVPVSLLLSLIVSFFIKETLTDKISES
ncbi:MAG: MFS transporter [Pseudomonadota bacterium]